MLVVRGRETKVLREDFRTVFKVIFFLLNLFLTQKNKKFYYWCFKAIRKKSVGGTRAGSPRKLTGSETERRRSPEKSSERLRKESIRARPGDPKHNWRILSDTVGFTAEGENHSVEVQDILEVGADGGSLFNINMSNISGGAK